MDYKDILNDQEAAIWEKYNKKFMTLKSKMDSVPATMNKRSFTTLNADAKIDFLTESMNLDIKTMYDFISTANKSYKELKASMDSEDTTHEFITHKALELLEIDSEAAWEKLKKACMMPDKNKDMWKLAYEGHFFGKTKGNQFGNFINRIAGKYAGWIIDKMIDDIDETALSNFTNHYKMSMDGNMDLKELGCAAHYIQDLTAPHHVGNMAIGFEILTDHAPTHYLFEKYARNYVYDNPDSFKGNAKKIYKELKSNFNGKNCSKFGMDIYKRASENIEEVKGLDDKAWKRAINKAIPLSIAATAVIMEPLKKM